MSTPNADEAVVGLMTRHALRGDLTVFYWGQGYGGTQEVLLTVPVFWLFGDGWLALRLVPVAITIVTALVIWRVGRRTIGEPAATVDRGAVLGLAAVRDLPARPPAGLLRQQRPLLRARAAAGAAGRRAAGPASGSGVRFRPRARVLADRADRPDRRGRDRVDGLEEAGCPAPDRLRRGRGRRRRSPVARLELDPQLEVPRAGGRRRCLRSLRLLASPTLPMLVGLRVPLSAKLLLPSALTYLVYVGLVALFIYGAYKVPASLDLASVRHRSGVSASVRRVVHDRAGDQHASLRNAARAGPRTAPRSVREDPAEGDRNRRVRHVRFRCHPRPDERLVQRGTASDELRSAGSGPATRCSWCRGTSTGSSRHSTGCT